MPVAAGVFVIPEATSTALPSAAPPLGLAVARSRAWVGWDEFLAGAEHRELAVVVERLLSRRGLASYSPLVLHGAAGTGKSHLLCRLATAASERLGTSVPVWRAADLPYRLPADIDETSPRPVATVESGPWLLVDELDDLSRDEAVQERLVRRLDEVRQRQGVACLVARRPPSELVHLIPRLATRLTAGLWLPLANPSHEVRREILRRFAWRYNLRITDDAAEALVLGVCGTVRDLLTAAMFLQSIASREAGLITTEQVALYLAQRKQRRGLSLVRLVQRIARRFGISPVEVRSASRRKSVVQARGLAMYLARELTGKSLTEIGAFFGGRDHSTVLHACTRTAQVLDSDAVLRSIAAAVREAWEGK